MMPFNVFARVKDMTRETKLGLVVSCSFLALLGVVLVLKVTERPEEGQGTEVAAAGPNEAPPDAKPAPAGVQQTRPPEEPGRLPALDDPNVKQASGVTESPPPPVKKEGAKPPPSGNTESGLPDVPPPAPPALTPAPTGDLSEFWGNVAIAARTNRSATTAPLPPTGTGAVVPPWPVEPSGLWATALLAARTKKSAPMALAGGTGAPGQKAGTDDVPPLPPVPGDGQKVAGEDNLPPIPGTEGTRPPAKATGASGWFAVAALAKGGSATTGSKGGASGTATPPPPPPPVTEKHDDIPPLPDLPPATGTGNTGGTASPTPQKPKKEDTPPLPPVPGKNVTPPPPPPTPDLPPADGAGKTGSAVTGAGTGKQDDSVPTIDVGNIGVNTGGSKPARANDPPPVGTKPPVSPRPAPAKEDEPIVVGMGSGASVPPLTLSPAPATGAVRSSQPDVVSYAEDSYVAAAGDTFQSISKAKYGTEAYGQALYLFNRSHPLAGDELLQSAALRAKQTVYLPPGQVLKSRYASVINDGGTPAASGVAVGTTARRADAFPAAARTYRVAPGGEKVYDIARNLLGDGNRWPEIQKLNPGWNWEMPIPADVSLQVPADARLPR
jgi:hypothetical protein